MQIVNDIAVFGDPIDEGAMAQIKRCIDAGALDGALMADHHKGYALPIGGVILYDKAVSPSGVGYDIACGNKAVKLDCKVADIYDDIHAIMDTIQSQISFGVGRVNKEEVDHDLFYDDAWKLPSLAPLKQLARNQLGTVGSGNHFIDIFGDEDGNVWVGVHFGSRGLGHKTATYFLKEGGAKDGIDVDPLVLSLDTDLGNDYLQAMNLCGRYAYAGRDWACDKVASIIGSQIVKEVHNHHNFAWREDFYGDDTWTVRKGATPLFPSQQAFIGGSMGDNSYIVEGVKSEESYFAFNSTVHGAGRVMSRTEARGKINRKTGERVSEGKISNDMMMDWVNSKGVVLRGAGTDEAPQAYKRIDEVLKHHKNSTRVIHNLYVLGVCMAGEHEIDPYKD